MMTATDALAKIGRGPSFSEDLARDEAHQLFSEMLEGKIPPVRLGALLMALRWKGETTEELLGFNAALPAYINTLRAPPGTDRVAVIPSYSLQLQAPLLMPALAIRLAQAGVPVLIHGGPCGVISPPSFDVFKHLGYKAATSLSSAQNDLMMHNLAIVPTEIIAPTLAKLLALRDELGTRHVGHILAKLIDPVPQRSLRLLCTSDPAMLEPLGSVLAASHAEALLMQSPDGESCADPDRRPRIAWFSEGRERVLYDEDAYVNPAHVTDDSFETTERQASRIQDMLDGRRPFPLPISTQLAACLYATGHARDLAHARAMVAIGMGRRGR